MEPEHNHVCEYCEAQAAQEQEVDLKGTYIRLAVASLSLVLGLAVQIAVAGIWHYPLFILSMAAAGREIIPRGFKGALRLHLDINFLMTSAAIGATLIGAPAEGAAVLLLFSVAEVLETRANSRVRQEIGTLLEMKSLTVSLLESANERKVQPEEVSVGQVFAVRPGERIGLDGTVLKGTTFTDESPITGESIPVSKSAGDKVYAGSINKEGYIEVQTTALARDTVLSRIVTLVEQAQRKRSNTESAVSRFAHIYTPAVVAASVLLGFASLLTGATLNASVYHALTLLVTSCPCALAISVPVSMVSSITGAAKDGVLVKGSRYIERLSKAKTIAFDKTGTLTEARLRVTQICPQEGFSEADVLTMAASLERGSEHPISQALQSEAWKRNLKLSAVDKFTAIPGRGIRGTVGGVEYVVGSERIVELAAKGNPGTDCVHGPSAHTGTSVHVIRDGVRMGSLTLADTARAESRETIDELRRMGISSVMLTGDNQSAAELVATEVGVDDVRSKLLPDQKVDEIHRLSSSGITIMVGDGVNDAPALAAADVGIAMGAISSDVALETADVALMKDDLSKIPPLVRRARRTMQIVRENIIVSLVVKMTVATMAVLGISTLWLAIGVGDMGLTLAVVANALRLLRSG